MAISNINPAQNSVIRPGESFSFDILNGYTSLVVKVVQSSGEEYAYDFALGGAQAGYTVSIEDLGGSDRYTISRDAGFNREPTVVKVAENQTGSTVITEFSYFLTATAIYPEGMQPYNDSYKGTLLVTEDDVQKENETGWMDFDEATFSVTSLGNGKVRIVGTAAAGNDPDAIHDNVAGEINAIAQKFTPDGADLLLIEDSANGLVKKKVAVQDLPTNSGSGGGGLKLGQWMYQAGNGDEVSWGGFRFSLTPPTYGNYVYFNMDQDNLTQDRTYVMELCGAGSYLMFREQGTEDYAIVPPVTAVNGQYPISATGSGGDYRRFFIDSSEVYTTSGFAWTYGTVYDVYVFGGFGATIMGGLMEQQHNIGFSNSFVAGDGNGKWGVQSHQKSETDPGPHSDFDGYKLGSLWSNEPNQSLWVCINNENPETNTALWRPLLEGTSESFGGSWSIDPAHGTPNANGEVDTDNSDPQLISTILMYKTNGGGTDKSAELEAVTIGQRLVFRFGEGTNFDYYDVTSVTDNTTYMTFGVTPATTDSVSYPRTAEDASTSFADLYLKRSGTQETAALYLQERADHVNTPAAGFAEVWCTDETEQQLIFTRDDGQDIGISTVLRGGAPTATDDRNSGHRPGTIWINTTLDDAYICCDDTPAAAVWKTIAT